MTIRDLGYRPYEGERLSAERNYFVLYRHALGRAFRSWIAKLVLLFSWVPVLGFLGASRLMGVEDPAKWVDILLHFQWLTAAFLLSVATGAGAVAYDLQHNAFAYFFSKPVEPLQYLTANVASVFTLCATVTVIPVALFCALQIGMTPDDVGKLFGVGARGVAAALLLSAFMACLAVGLSATSESRAFTLSSYILLFVVPAGLGNLLQALAEVPWLRLASPPSLASVLAEELLGTSDPEEKLQWFHTAPVMVALAVGAIYIAYRKVRAVEVIA